MLWGLLGSRLVLEHYYIDVGLVAIYILVEDIDVVEQVDLHLRLLGPNLA